MLYDWLFIFVVLPMVIRSGNDDETSTAPLMKEERSNAWVWIIVISVLLAIVVGVVLCFLWRKGKINEKKKEAKKKSTTVKPLTTSPSNTRSKGSSIQKNTETQTSKKTKAIEKKKEEEKSRHSKEKKLEERKMQPKEKQMEQVPRENSSSIESTRVIVEKMIEGSNGSWKVVNEISSDFSFDISSFSEL